MSSGLCIESSRKLKCFVDIKIWIDKVKLIFHFLEAIFHFFTKKQQKFTFGWQHSNCFKITNFCPNYMIENAGESWDLVLQNGKKIFLIELSYLHLSNSWNLAAFLLNLLNFQICLSENRLTPATNFFDHFVELDLSFRMNCQPCNLDKNSLL